MRVPWPDITLSWESGKMILFLQHQRKTHWFHKLALTESVNKPAMEGIEFVSVKLENEEPMSIPFMEETAMKFEPVLCVKQEVPDIKEEYDFDDNISGSKLQTTDEFTMGNSRTGLVEGLNDYISPPNEDTSDSETFQPAKVSSAFSLSRNVTECCNLVNSDILHSKDKNVHMKCKQILTTLPPHVAVKEQSSRRRKTRFTEYRKHECHVCGKCFNERSHLNGHLKIHFGEKNFKCKVCGKCFLRDSTLTSHLKVHFGVKNHVCVHCDKSFNRSSSLTRHLKIHSGEKNFKCDVCGNDFTELYHLRDHLKRRYCGEKYKCEVCNRYFTQRHNLERHLKVHSHKSNLVKY